MLNISSYNAILFTDKGEIISQTKARAIVIYSSEQDIVPFAEELLRRNISGKTWIASSPWAASPLISVPRYTDTLYGTIGVAWKRGMIPGLQGFLKKLKPILPKKNIKKKELFLSSSNRKLNSNHEVS